MKRIVTKRSYKVGLWAMALALLMSTAGGVTAGAQGHKFTSSDSSAMRNTQVLVKGNTSNRSSQDGPVKILKVATPRAASYSSKNKSKSIWDKVKLFFWELVHGFHFYRLFGIH
ncbi:TPA: hypothetical protein U0927_000751 [Streptococcus suis 2524]|uniref:SSU0592/SSU0593 family protein n=1 Tax=Streptococcus suis TaxID=1307 RepID=UPI0004042AEB|nr:hypothetical protein [Streptococcus suis]RRR30807.1 hypothetical protein EI988_06115 [Streptococcus suis]RRR38006.1 hypothetical protein EI984_05965 [Streptococcus suis]RRR53157.1 hypothetical protein EI990_05805 [Streptococcus suis]RRR58072.1 hypothetical protein EI986_06165 [Streptococcus suis]HEM3217329.1 hypothetical protein [Streptococcus suis 2524]